MLLLLQLMNTGRLGMQTQSRLFARPQYNQSQENSLAANKLWKKFNRTVRYHVFAIIIGILIMVTVIPEGSPISCKKPLQTAGLMR